MAPSPRGFAFLVTLALCASVILTAHSAAARRQGNPDALLYLPGPAKTVSDWRAQFGFEPPAIAFDSGSASLSTAAQNTLRKMAAALAKPEEAGLQLELRGNADAAEPDGLALSQHRADAVRAALVKLGVGEARLSVYAEGSRAKAAPATTDENRAKNRRVDVIPIPTPATPRLVAPIGFTWMFPLSMNLSSDGRYAVVGVNPPALWDLAHKVCLRKLTYGQAPQFSPNGLYLAVICLVLQPSAAASIVIFDVHTGEALYRITGPATAYPLLGFAWNPNSSGLAFVTGQDLVTVALSGGSFKELKRLHLPMPENVLVWDPSDRFLALGALGHDELSVRDPVTLQQTQSLSVKYLLSMAATSDGRYLVAADDTRTLTAWRTDAWTARTMHIQELCHDVMASPSGDRVLIDDFGGGDHDHLLLADVSTMSRVAEVETGEMKPGGYTADGKSITCADARGFCTFASDTLKAQPLLDPTPGQAVDIQADPDHESVAVLSTNGISAWNVRTGERLFEYPGHYIKLYPMPGSPGRYLTYSVSASSGKSTVVEIDSVAKQAKALDTVSLRLDALAVGKNVFAMAGVPFTPGNQGSPTAKIVTDSLSGSRLDAIQVPTVTGELRSGDLTQAGIKALGVSDDGSRVVVGTQWEDGFGQGYAPSRKAIVYSMSDGHELHAFDVQQYVMEASFDPGNPGHIKVTDMRETHTFDATTWDQVTSERRSPFVNLQDFDAGQLATTTFGIFLQSKDKTLVALPWTDIMPLNALFPKLKTIVTMNDAGTLEFRAMDTLLPYATIDATQTDRWFAFAPDGRFDHSANGLEGHYWDRGANLVPVADSDSGHTPSLVSKLVDEAFEAQSASVQAGVDFQDGGFESPAVDKGQSKQDFTDLPWTAALGPNAHWGIANGSGYWGAGPVEGAQYCFLQRQVTLTQLVSGLKPGQMYRVSFQAMRGSAAATNNDVMPLSVLADGQVVVPAFTPFNRSWERFRSKVFKATSTTCKIEFQTQDIGVDASDLIDDVHLLSVSPAGH